MPTKHIPDSTWNKVEKKFVEVIVETKAPVKDTQVLNWLILKGLEEINEEDYRRFIKEKK